MMSFKLRWLIVGCLLVGCSDDGANPASTPVPPVVVASPPEQLPPVEDGAVEIRFAEPVSAEVAQQAAQRLVKVGISKSNRMRSANGQTTITLYNVTDAKAVGDVIDFGEVVELDATQRRLKVRLDAEKLASVAPPIAKSKSETIFEAEQRRFDEQLRQRGSSSAALAATKVGGIELVPQSFLNGKVSLLLPKDFRPMNEEELQLKFPSERRPTLVYCNEAGTVTVAINHTKNPLLPNQIGEFHQQIDGMFRKLYPSAKWFKSELLSIQGRRWMILDFRSPAVDTEIRNVMTGTYLENRALMVTLSATQALEDEWQPPFATIVQSLRANP